MQSSNTQYGQRVMAVLIFISLIVHWEILTGIASFNFYYNLVAIPWVLLSVSTAWALWTNRIWGFWLLYLTLAYSTVALSIPIVPFISNLFSLTARPWIMITMNTLALFINIRLHMQHNKVKK